MTRRATQNRARHTRARSSRSCSGSVRRRAADQAPSRSASRARYRRPRIWARARRHMRATRFAPSSLEGRAIDFPLDQIELRNARFGRRRKCGFKARISDLRGCKQGDRWGRRRGRKRVRTGVRGSRGQRTNESLPAVWYPCRSCLRFLRTSWGTRSRMRCSRVSTTCCR